MTIESMKRVLITGANSFVGINVEKWLDAYPFYANVKKEGVELYEAA